MTLVSNTIKRMDISRSQDGALWWNAGSNSWQWDNSAGTYSTDPGNPGNYPYIGRMDLDIPRRAKIVSAVFNVAYTMKDAAVANSCTLRVNVEAAVNSAQWPFTNGTLMGATFPRVSYGYVDTTITHAAGAAAPYIKPVDLTAMIQDLVNAEEWYPGQNISVMIETRAESGNMSIYHSEQGFTDHCGWVITYEYDDTIADRVEVNRSLIETMEQSLGQRPNTLDSITNQSHYDTRAEGTTFSLSTAVGGAPGSGGTALRTQSNAPAGQEGRPFGGFFTLDVSNGDWLNVSGWFYNPSSNQGNFRAQDVWIGFNSSYSSTTRNAWTHFSTQPYKFTQDGFIYFIMELDKAEPGAYFFVDGVNARVGKRNGGIKIFPWHALTAPKPGRIIKATTSTDWGTSIQNGSMAAYTLDGVVAKPRPKYAHARASGLASIIGLTWTDIRGANLVGTFGVIGAGDRADFVSGADKHWSRVRRTSTTGGVTFRCYVPLKYLSNGSSYTCSMEVYNDTATPVDIGIDWCDSPSVTATIAPGESRLMAITGSRATYDATYRFFDLTLITTTNLASILVREPRVVPSRTGTWSDVPSGRWMDIAAPTTWGEL